MADRKPRPSSTLSTKSEGAVARLGGGGGGSTRVCVGGGKGRTGLALGNGAGGGASPGGSGATEERSGSRNSQEAKPSRLVSPALQIAHQVISASNRTRPTETIS